mmetsp:Transcript_114547/g.208368  ORF Transcript_114547/g.208368 Transcript_114547/m.208368 type:complete len:840 (-) Transcript_114547:134-2653(-)
MSKRRGPQQKPEQPALATGAAAAPQVQAPAAAPPKTRPAVVRQPSQQPLEKWSTAAGAAAETVSAAPTPLTQGMKAPATPGLKVPTTPAPAGPAVPGTPRQASQRSAQSQPPLKKIKKEPMESPTPARSPRSARSVPPPLTAEQSRGRSPNPEQAAKRHRAGHASGRSSRGGIAWALSNVRAHMERILEVEGVRDLADQFPAVVLIGGIAARRELVAALLGEHLHANSAAASLVAPGMRQPLAMELRHSSSPADIAAASGGDQADKWLANVARIASGALGNKFKVETLRFRISSYGCFNLDVVDLPEKGSNPTTGISPKTAAMVEEMRVRHLGSTSNILVCLEPGQSLDLARRFDPSQQRSIFLGAAAASGQVGDSIPELCGPAAARELEERFAALCHERCPKWLAGLERLEMKLSRVQHETAEACQLEATSEILRRARAAGVSFGRALQHVVSGTPGCQSGALTLEEELEEFATAAAQHVCGTGGLSGHSAAVAAEEVWSSFPDGRKGYIAYIKKEVGISSAEVPLNGGAAWQRLLEEIDVAMRLAQPPEEELRGLLLGAIQAGGTGIHGHQRWDDVASKLLLTIAFDPLLRRVRYVAARVAWALRQQKTAVADWMATLESGPSARIYSNIFSQHVAVLRSSPITRELVFGAFDKAAAEVADLLLKNLEGTLSAGCLNPQIMLRPHTEPELDPSSQTASVKMGRAGGKDSKDRQRVKAEMRKRSGESGGLPVQLRDRIFSAKDAEKALPHVEKELRRAFSKLQLILANQSYAFADTTLSALCRRHVDEAMNAIDFSPEQHQALSMREAELQSNAKQANERLETVRTCIAELRNARTGP